MEEIDNKIRINLEIEKIEEEFPVMDYQELDSLLGKIDNIRPIDTKYINECFIKNIIPKYA